MTIIFLFIDGVGLGENDPEINPFLKASIPFIEGSIGNYKISISTPEIHNQTATFRSIDPLLNIEGIPQSASGQAAILTGLNIPSIIGQHYGPKPNPAIKEHLRNGNIFKSISKSGSKAVLLNAYPSRYFEAIFQNHRIPGSIAYSVIGSGLKLKNTGDLERGLAVSADFTGSGWKSHLGMDNIPTMEPREAGRRISDLSKDFDFVMFEYWLCDYAGHKQDFRQALHLLATIDDVVCGIVDGFDPYKDLLILTSDHGNMEDLSTRRHTRNPVPLLLFGSPRLRERALDEIDDLTGIAPFILKTLGVSV